MSWRKTYTGYSIGCAIVWAVILSVVAVVYPNRLRTFLLIGGGWWIGWTSATIARSVYPPPKLSSPRRRLRAGDLNITANNRERSGLRGAD